MYQTYFRAVGICYWEDDCDARKKLSKQKRDEPIQVVE